ncbi:hypothetical protein LMH87_005150 [Akanthomyces muscarius]|uniref:Arginine N-methyltransferase 2 n=1 Tax=Akanthomyces muscarius TaxID=2231603 RepID=A0A9W8URU4_AKAMU|nr:hypothetical protein LMH87_005150 [Akanthomyces muscarius]KAJ4163419.1 hypothetical protein LMH87_005150 [Akanthomyces muscarius]
MPEYNDALEARIPTDSPDNVRQVLLHAWSRDLTTLKELLSQPGAASEQDPKTGETPLHAVVRGCGPSEQAADDAAAEGEEEEDGVVAEARACIQELFFSGAIWNDVDNHNETPGCTAWRLGQKQLYQMFVDAGVRAELLFGLMDGYEQLSSGEEEEEEEADADMEEAEQQAQTKEEGAPTKEKEEALPAGEEPAQFVPPDAGEKTVTSDEYLQSTVTYDGGKLLDDDLNGVMMAWETDIMRRSVAALLPDPTPGKRILNIGFGMGIVDGLFAARSPAKHHIVEAHPGVLAHVARGGTRFGADWEQGGPEPDAFKMFHGRWQDVVQTLMERGELYDAIYFDTFGEDYAELRSFFTDYVPVLLDMDGRFGFFNGLGADRRVCYDVYAQVVELHASEAGLDIAWESIDVDMSQLDEDGKGEWEGVRRRYWTLDTYKLPICTFMG